MAAVFGGIGNVPGAMVGGLVLGLAEEYVAGYALSSYRDGIAFAMLILVLLVRPAGLFGRVRGGEGVACEHSGSPCGRWPRSWSAFPSSGS